MPLVVIEVMIEAPLMQYLLRAPVLEALVHHKDLSPILEVQPLPELRWQPRLVQME